MNNVFRNPTMVIPNIDRIDTNLIDLLSRLNKYGVAYTDNHGDSNCKLNIVCGSSDITKLLELSFSNLEIHAVQLNSFGIIKFISFFKALIDNGKLNIGMLIAGDPFRGLFACKCIRFICKVNSPLQAQSHGEIGLDGFGSSFKNRIKNRIFKSLIRNVDSFRLVIVGL